MGRGRRMGDGGLGVTQVGGDRNDFRRINEAPRRLFTALDLEAHHRTEGTLLPLGQLVLRVAGQPGVVDLVDAWLGLQPLCQCQRTGAVGLHAHTQGLQPLEEHPGIERAEGRPGGPQEAHHRLHLGLAPGNHTAEAAALAIDVLGRRVHDDVRTELQRLLQRRRAEAVVDHQQRLVGMGNLGQSGDIHQLGQRVGWRLDEQQLGVGLERRLPGCQIGQRRVIHLDAETLEVLLEQADGRAEHAARHQHMVAGAALAHHDGQDRGHAGRGGHRLLGAFQSGNALLEGAHGRVGVARVDVARLLAGKARGGVSGAAEHIAGGEEHGLAMLTLRRAMLTGTHRQGIEADAFEVAVQPPRFPLQTHCAALSRCAGR